MARAPADSPIDVARLVTQADITTIAERIGLQLDGRRQEPRRAICPFHDDKDPSLHLYGGGRGQSERGHYHCFVCGAHGDVVSLIQNYEKLPFWEAVRRLAALEGVVLRSGRLPLIDRVSGALLLKQQLDAAPLDDKRFESFAEIRGFDQNFLRSRGIAVANLADLIRRARSDRTVEEQLVEAGILRRGETADEASDLYGSQLRAFFGGYRAVFPIDGPSEEIVGFAARALGEEKPKYLYSFDFPRRTTLYGEGRPASYPATVWP